MKLFRADPPSRPPGPYPSCLCFDTSGSRHAPRVPRLHDDAQDTGAAGWLRVLERIDSAIRSGAEELAPLEGLSGPERAAVVTLPPTIRQLDRVRRLRLYSSHLVRLPPEIGEMHSLEYLDVYTSYRLHYFPYGSLVAQACEPPVSALELSMGITSIERRSPISRIPPMSILQGEGCFSVAASAGHRSDHRASRFAGSPSRWERTICRSSSAHAQPRA